MAFSFWCALIKPPKEHSTPGSLKALPVSLVEPVAYLKDRVSLWMEALEPGKPLSFLDHRIQCGNSLIGATPALLRHGIPDDAFKPIEGDDRTVCSEYRKHNKQEREGQQRLFAHAPEPWQRLGHLATGLLQLEEISDDSIAGVRRKQERWEELVRSQGPAIGLMRPRSKPASKTTGIVAGSSIGGTSAAPQTNAPSSPAYFLSQVVVTQCF